jgi:CHASE3 domain sensor protein
MKKMQELFHQLRATSDELQRLAAQEARLSSEISAADVAFPESRFEELSTIVEKTSNRVGDSQHIMTQASDFMGKFTADEIAILAKRSPLAHLRC